MGRIIAQTKVTNLLDETKFVQCGMLVDTGAAALILPASWKDRLGEFPRSEAVELLLANGEAVRGEACAPVEIAIEGFRPVVNEVVFVGGATLREHAKTEANTRLAANNAVGDGAISAHDGEEPLLGYVILEQAQAAVDMLGHRLTPVRYIDMK